MFKAVGADIVEWLCDSKAQKQGRVLNSPAFNPYYSLSDFVKYEDECEKYKDNALFETLTADFTLKNKTDYQMPVYILYAFYFLTYK